MIDWINPLEIGVVWIIVNWIIRITALFVVPRNRKPSSAMAWLLLIFLLPILGLLLFLIIGSPKLPAARREAQQTLDRFIKQALKSLQRNNGNSHLLSAAAPEKYQAIAKLSQALGHLPVFDGNKLEVLADYEGAIMRIARDVDGAKSFVHIEYFIIALDGTTEPLFDALERAVKRGVVIRVMYDALSTRGYPGKKEMLKRLESSGAYVQPMLPIKIGRGYVRPDLRNHRKLVVVDGQIGYSGSQNLVQSNYHRKDEIYYDELVVRIQGPVVLQLAAVFLTDWYSETGELLDHRKYANLPKVVKSFGNSLAQILPSGPGYEDENNLKLFTALIHAAQKKIVIVNPYFVPDESLLTAITSASRRGVEVIMINSEVMDQWMVGHAQRSFYEVLLKAGVRIFLYEAPVLLHSKFITVDGDIATVGSSNLDIRSFELDLEVTLISYDSYVVKKLNKVVAAYLERSNELKLEEWSKRSRRSLLLDNLARLTSALQ